MTRLAAALLVLDTRLDPRDWRPPAHRAGARGPVFARLDAVVIMRMHGLVLAVHEATPAVAVDPVLGVGTAGDDRGRDLTAHTLDRWWRWCLSHEGRAVGCGAEALGTHCS
ncbi:hypothetical protein [Dietzia maris]|uniref:hypothetical protein n=1 Tax=Dietzia maris TaxID=37915 RepID=UPI00227341F5